MNDGSSRFLQFHRSQCCPQLQTAKGLRRLSLRVARLKGTVTMSQFKAVMLASMRSLVPKDWDGDFEVAWNRLWDNIQRMLQVRIGRPPVMCAALKSFATTLDKATQTSSGTTSLLHFRASACRVGQVQTVQHSMVLDCR